MYFPVVALINADMEFFMMIYEWLGAGSCGCQAAET